MADQHTHTNGAGKNTGTTPKADEQPNTDLNQSVTPTPGNWDGNPFALPPMEAEKKATTPVTSEPDPTAPTPGTETPFTGFSFDTSEREAKNAAAREFAAPSENPSTAPSESPSAAPSSPSPSPSTPEVTPAGSSTTTAATLENFQKEMKWERHGYRPTAYFKTVEDARSSHHDLNKTEAYVSVKHGGFTAEELAAIPDNAKQKNYYIGFAKQMLDSNEGIFTRKFWTSFEGIKKVFSAGIIKGEVEEVRLEAAEWLLSKRGGATTEAASPSPETTPGAGSGATQEESKETAQDAGPKAQPSTSPAESAEPSPEVGKKERIVETKTLDTAALQEIEKRIQEKLEALRGRIVPETITVRLDDPKSAQAVRQMQRYGEGFNAGFATQVNKVHEAIDAIGKLGLDQPQQAIVFKRRQEEALGLVDSLSFGQSELQQMATHIKVPRGNKLPDSMKESMAKSTDILEGIKSDLEEARRLIAAARRINPAAKAEQDTAAHPSDGPKVDVQTGSVATMPRLGKDLTIDPRKLEMMGHAMVDANISDKDLNAWYKMVMSEFVKSYVGTFSKVRKEIYEARMDGSNMTEMQKEKFKFLADELGTEVKVSDLVQLDYSKFSLPYTEELDTRFRRVIDGSKFQKALNQMKAEFATALTKEIEKVPGAENSDTTYVAFKRDKYEKTKGFLAFEEAEKAVG